MKAEFRNWREYQEAVAAVFRELDCQVEVDKKVHGTRGTHDVDVYVTFPKFGQECQWLIECKLWNRGVDKSAVLKLQSIVQNVGADRGVIFSESGFQSGAREAAHSSNILLQDSLGDFRRTAKLHLHRTPLITLASPEPDVPPVYGIPGGYQPHHLLKHDGRLFVSNWGTPQKGNIAIVDPLARTLDGIIELDKYEVRTASERRPRVVQHLPGNIACANGKLFVGQVFSDSVLVIDIESQAIVKRISIPGGGEGAVAASPDEGTVYFASNKFPSFFVIDSVEYDYSEVSYPEGARGCLCVLAHPSKPLLYIGIQRGGSSPPIAPTGGGACLAVYDLSERRYLANLNLAEDNGGRGDDSIPFCLSFDESDHSIYVGMMQSLRGLLRLDELGREVLDEIRFESNECNRHFPWVDPLSQALYRDRLISVNRNNCELVAIDKKTGRVELSSYLGDAPNGPHSVAIFGETAVISYPERGGLIFHNLASTASD